MAVVMTVVLARDVIAPRARIARRLQRLVYGRRDVIGASVATCNAVVTLSGGSPSPATRTRVEPNL